MKDFILHPITVAVAILVVAIAARATIEQDVSARAKSVLAASGKEDLTLPADDAISIRPTQPIVVHPAPVQVVVQADGRTIDFAAWPGYHADHQVRLAVRYLIYVRPHTATDANGVTRTGSALAVWPEGVWYTLESTASLTARLAAVGWGDAASTLQVAKPAEGATR